MNLTSEWPIFVSFHTPSYARVAAKLRASLKEFDLPYHTEEIEDLGSWVKNCAYKPKFCWKMMEKYPDRALCWIDADATVEEFPTLFRRRLDCDIAVHKYQKPNRSRSIEVLSGTVYLAPTTRARMLVDRWIEECYLSPSAWDQRALQAAMSKVDGLRIHQLPVEYCWILDTHARENPTKSPTILHHQYSRIVKGRRR